MGIEQASLSLEQALGLLRRRAPWILLCFVLVAGAAYGFSKHQTKKYTATASLVFNNNQLEPAGRRACRRPSSGGPSRRCRTRTSSSSSSATWRRRPRALLGQGLTKEKVERGSERERGRGIEHRQRLRHRDLAGARGRYREHLHQQFVTEQQNSNHAYYASALALVNKQLGGALPAAAGRHGRARAGGSRAVAGDPRRTAQRQRPGRAGRDGPDVAVLAEDREEHGPRRGPGPAARARRRVPARALRPADQGAEGPRGDLRPAAARRRPGECGAFSLWRRASSNAQRGPAARARPRRFI